MSPDPYFPRALPSRDLASLAKRLERTKYEDLLAKQLDMAGLGLPVPERQYRFCADRRWLFDFAFTTRMLAIEVEGGLYSAGRHVRGAGYEADLEKYARATLLGWRLLRVSGRMVEDGRALKWTEQALAMKP